MGGKRPSVRTVLLVVFAFLAAGFSATPASAAPTDPPLIASCLSQHVPSSAYTPAGWFESRTEWCRNSTLQAAEVGNGAGEFVARATIGVTTSPRDLHVHVDVKITVVSATGTLANPFLEIQLPCGGCTPGAARGRGATLSEWKTNGYASFDFVGKTGGGSDKAAKHKFHPRFILNQGIVRDGAEGMFRCDAYTSVSKTVQGCVFPQDIPTLLYHVLSKGRDAVLHIQDALNHPNSTEPKWTGEDAGKKTIPRFLHRLVNPSKQRANARAAKKVCLAIDAHYTSKGEECDEYPFQSTEEGANKGDKRFSARPIIASENSSAGGTLSAFYASYRILNGDEFQVAVAP